MITRPFALLLVAVSAGCAALPGNGPHVEAGQRTNGEAEVRNIILMIADGAGMGAWTAAKYARNDLAIADFPVMGLVDTRSASHKVTGSAAGASVYASGERVSNRTINVGPASACPDPGREPRNGSAWPPGCKPLRSWFEAARDKSRATGIVTTTFVIDATPAAFVAHSPSRYRFEELAQQVADSGLDVLLGGGAQFFKDERNLHAKMCAHSTCLDSAGELRAYRPDHRPLVGLLADGELDPDGEHKTGLPDMVRAALEKLALDEDGFVAMFESEATDSAGHANVPLDELAAHILEFDDAVALALDFARRTPGTLLIVTADHETGGVSLVESGEDFNLHYASHGHTAALVPLFAYGPRAERFAGLRENYEIGRLLNDITGGW